MREQLAKMKAEALEALGRVQTQYDMDTLRVQ